MWTLIPPISSSPLSLSTPLEHSRLPCHPGTPQSCARRHRDAIVVVVVVVAATAATAAVERRFANKRIELPAGATPTNHHPAPSSSPTASQSPRQLQLLRRPRNHVYEDYSCGHSESEKAPCATSKRANCGVLNTKTVKHDEKCDHCDRN
ncbi:hypothetical protein K491DRAFT_673072 [Lophiostoma macrostomum CBS 122681]|uniref:Uncharacterized protein n=1 Tax=Lophiostoma macrostomum CBS 122681 TaxID=1314788 RepID=A0A6A6TRY8_9PLEO|nr:hypothetical protein K491DRAFT_673072 [Lophiostoma macrostomum CBS 122681]